MKKTTVIQRFSLLCFVALVIFAIVLQWAIDSSLEQNMLQRAEKVTARIVTKAIRDAFTANDFTKPKTGPEYDPFEKKIKHLLLVTEIERIKIWNKDHRVIWSDEKELIGQRFPDDEDLKEALRGHISADFSTLDRPENKYEHQFKKLLELYVPIRFDKAGGIDTVVEIYRNLDPLYANLARERQVVWLVTVLGFSFLYVLLFGIVWRASRQIEKQTREIRQSEERYRSLVQSAPDAIVAVDGTGKVALFNQAAEAMFEYSAEEMIGEDPARLMPEPYRERHRFGIHRFLKNGHITILGKTTEMEGLRRNGRSFPVELSLSSDGEGNGHAVTGIIRDISARKAIQAQLNEMERQSSISTVAGSIGHEINNITGGLLGYADLLKAKPDDRHLVLKSADIVGSQTQRLKLHAQNLLRLSRPQEPDMRPLELNGLIEKVTDLLYTSGLLKSCTIIKEYTEDLPLVPGDEMLLEELLTNLEINAAHAMNEKGILTLRTWQPEDGSTIAFSIGDTGHGIPDDRRNQIFLPFFTTKEKGKGTGLGMYIVKHIVEKHKGEIQIDSNVGVGTTVTVRLPMSIN